MFGLSVFAAFVAEQPCGNEQMARYDCGLNQTKVDERQSFKHILMLQIK
ncbi:hypothetical protein [Nitrosomonas sp.]|nr:hypothetical protein [Nitrosomonas sp.]